LQSFDPEPFLVVIEAKVAPDKAENIKQQIEAYRKCISSEVFKEFRDRQLIILLTPYADEHADAHLSWDQVYDALHQAYNAPSEDLTRNTEAVLRQFAEFLKIRHLAKMKIPPIAPLLPSLKKVAPLLAGLDAIFESLRNDEIAKSIFRKDSVVPKMEYHSSKEEDYLWYGIWSRGGSPIYLVGFHTSCSNPEPLRMSVQVMFEGDKTNEVLPKSIKGEFNEKDSGREGNKTNFIFTKDITTGEDTAAAIEGWLLARLHDVKAWAETVA
jgi:hypothetical protein